MLILLYYVYNLNFSKVWFDLIGLNIEILLGIRLFKQHNLYVVQKDQIYKAIQLKKKIKKLFPNLKCFLIVYIHTFFSFLYTLTFRYFVNL